MQLFETYSGADFLAFYAVMLVTCAGLSVWIVAHFRPEGRNSRLSDPEDIALLSGGAQRHALTVLADLYVQGAIERAKKAKVAVARTGIEVTPAGAAVLRKVGDFSLSETMRTLADHADRRERDLIKRGLLLEKSDLTRLRIVAIAPFVTLALIGMYRYRAGEALGEPTDYLLVLLIVTGVAATLRLAMINRRTDAGEQALRKWRGRSSRIKRAPEGSEVPLAVGLFGTGVLAGTPYAHVHAMRQAASGGDGGSSDGGDGGGAGCGGGCGGCGG
ncbi:MAG: TIGR04222 domain-containing membrane protein [Pseudomonadota bacterium]